MAKIKFTQLETLTTQSVNLSALMPVVQDGENYNIALSSLPSSGGGGGNTSTECVSSRCLKNTISEDPYDVRGFELDRIWDQPVFKGEGSIITFDDVVDTDVKLTKVQMTIKFTGTGDPSGEPPNYYYDVRWTVFFSSSNSAYFFPNMLTGLDGGSQRIKIEIIDNKLVFRYNSLYEGIVSCTGKAFYAPLEPSFEFEGEEEDVLVLEVNPENEFTLE